MLFDEFTGLLAHKPTVIATGVGKSGIAARYFADVLASMDAPVYYEHATELLHGSLGRIGKDTVVVAFSASGATSEVWQVLRRAADRGAICVLVSGRMIEPLYGVRMICLNVGPEDEMVGRIPTASFLAQATFTCAVVVALAGRGWDPDAQRNVHPGGYLGGVDG